MFTKNKIRQQRDVDVPFSYMIKQCLVFIPVFFLTCLVVSLITGLIFFNTDDPTSRVSIASVISLYISSFICSFIVTKRVKEKTLLCSLIYSLILFFITYSVSLFLNNGNSIIIKLGIIGVSILAGLLTKKKTTRKIKHKRLH